MSSESIKDYTEETNGRMVRKRQRIMDYFVVADNATRSDTASASASAASIGSPTSKRGRKAGSKNASNHKAGGVRKNAGRPAGGSKPVQKAGTSSRLALPTLPPDLPTDEEDEIPLVRNRRKRLSLMRRGHFKEQDCVGGGAITNGSDAEAGVMTDENTRRAIGWMSERNLVTNDLRWMILRAAREKMTKIADDNELWAYGRHIEKKQNVSSLYKALLDGKLWVDPPDPVQT
ncbi:hypothetical protein BC829DRAFT_448953 [Chytridium lagenaria]|nr:hypothetical protein BC829DRAFT_448953 [Chytridium lagenaria]